MMGRGSVRTQLVALAAVVGLGLTACGGGDISETDTSGKSDCGDLRIAINPWTGYVSNAHVIGQIAKEKLGCNVTYPEVKEEVGWQGMASGDIDTIVENWGHDDLVKKYIDGQGSVEDAGKTGNEGLIGWFVPQWMADKYPDITDYKNLNKYAKLFKTSESGDKGQLLFGDPSFVSNEAALIKNLKLDLKIVTGGSEAALIKGAQQAQAQKKPLLFYFWDPHWLFSKTELVRVNLPPYTEGCDADPKKVACDYAELDLDKIVSKKFADSGSPAYDLVKKFQWTNDDQNVVGKYIAADGMSPEDAAAKWVEDNQDKVDAWTS
jgi:glycine betaine/proline transport system substrate-binding protein